MVEKYEKHCFAIPLSQEASEEYKSKTVLVFFTLVFPDPGDNLYNHYEGNEQSIGWFPASMSCILSRDNLANLFYFFVFFLVTLLFDITKIKEKLLFSIRELKKPACLGSKYIWKEML